MRDLHAALNPIETLFVVDAMLGQDAVNTAKAFNEALPLTGVILTKLDGDARGGAALSVRQVTGKPLKFAGIGEKLNGLEEFHPERMAARILGMGDILGLVEEAHRNVDQEKAQEFVKKMKSGKGFDLNDFKEQIGQMRKMGGLSSLLEKLPAQFGADGATGGRRGGGQVDSAHRGHHQLHDAGRAGEARSHQGQSQAPHCHGCRRPGAGSESSAQPVRADAKDDEAVFQGRYGQDDAGHEGPACRERGSYFRASMTRCPQPHCRSQAPRTMFGYSGAPRLPL